ncbi:hypothetical protein EN833_23365 [Mesorhizobium sp. M4B.F.Ca.ET.190.01.1.1]|uniref:hypothetical protein n=1 Tax=unclassified Mesorhizobium TaxID=325217 RepID=UPI001092789C|nr:MULTISPECIES: hypothetical protein [unclassified Mesorhizobium]TGR05414.1 hypothetical protein EN843_23355 [Mesorhizobium sp. M4B.F.Ca.ET.200.01.1.1]TGS15670.1 hypothetical protein EN833_23365 [Mesorhizobium sp. M4B.F.Ca.ET.190.01.1.1]TGT27730.1 hypothetical protein EN815_23340 [Mesorhizobium sp. M4B.F.Ca.ET.172.01.1.1]
MADKGRARKGKRTTIGGQFGWQLLEMKASPAFRALSLSGHRILARLEIEVGQHGGNDNGKLPTTFDQFEEYGIHRHAIAPAIREVVALGFVEITQEGRSGNGEWRRPNLFRLTYRPTELTEPTDAWRKIETMEAADLLARTARQSSEKQNTSGGKRQISVRKPHHKPNFCSAETTTTIHGAETTTTSISRDQSAEDPKPIGPVSPALLKQMERRGWTQRRGRA